MIYSINFMSSYIFPKQISSADHDNKTLGCIVFIWSLIDLLYFIVSFKKGIVFILYFILHFVALILHSAGIWSDFHDNVELASCVIGVTASGIAVYIGFGLIINNTYQIIVLPLGIFEEEENDLKFE